MAIWAIGDIQGCYDELQGLLEQINFDTHHDTLWFVGDLVNRGPKSLESLRFLHHLNAITVLGNHDLHLLASAHLPKYRKHKDTLQQIIHAEDGPELLDWLRHQPLLHHDQHSGYTLIHAGLPPQWDLNTAKRCANEVETALRGPDYMDFLEALYGNHPNLWSESLQGHDRLRFITNCLTRLRYCDANGRLALEHKGAPGTQPKHLKPWFEWPRQSADMKILFGHWSTLGAFDGEGIHALDTGCLWGGTLTALRVDMPEPKRVEYACPAASSPLETE